MSTFNREGCETDSAGIMKQGLREDISSTIMYAFQFYYTFLQEPNKKDPAVISSYLDNPLIRDNSNYST